MSFVHLHCHSQYSLLEATGQMKQLANLASENKMPALAVTDYGNMFGAIEYYFAANAAGIRPILGFEAYIAPKSRLTKGEDPNLLKIPNRRVVLLAQNFEGYQNLCKLSSIGYQEGFYYRPRIDYEVLNKYSDHVLALSGGVMGEIPWTLINKGKDEALEKVKEYKKIFGDRFYLELNRTGEKDWDTINPFFQEVSAKHNISLVAANNIHYVKQEDQIAQEVLICIGSNKTLQDEGRFRLGSDQYYFKTADQMRELFKDIPEACDNTLEVAERCQVKFKLQDDDGKPIYHLPSFPTSKGNSISDEIYNLSMEGLEERFAQAKKIGEEITDRDIYYDRLKFELEVIEKMGFNGYFLIVQDFINWAKDNDIPVGPGRGSGAGSLVAYSLGITDLDPMPYHLIFERFLNPERISMPDFDIDFCQEGRGRVIDYVTQKYGQESVSQIITYGRLQTRAAIRDVGRVMGMTYAEVDVVSKLIPDKLGITLKEAIEEEPRIRDLMEADPKVETLMDLAQKVEGLCRHAGIHAAGVIIADGNIVSHAPLYKGVEGENVVQYDMKHAEKIGLTKFDFLGLKTLTHINDALKLIKKNQNKVIKTTEISLSDKGIYELMCKGDTAGIFQFESDGITDLIRKAQPDCFEDIVAINALYRPGPMDMIPDYLDRKHGRKKPDYMFPELEEILKETYGIVVYQEQVQLIAAKVANYSLGEADMLRRAMGKKIAEVMAEQKVRFLAGAKENDKNPKKAEKLFDTMAKFAEYGFNKSHAAAYCVIAAQTAYIKNYYPTEFFAALLGTEMNDTDKVVKYVKDAQKHDIEVRSPHINYSDFKFTVEGRKIFFSLGAIKGVGQAAVEAIIESRKEQPNGKFETLEKFFEVIDLRRVNKKTIECLIKAGALDDFGANRAELMEGYAYFIERADRARKDSETGQSSLFSMNEEVQEQEKVKLERREPWSRTARLSYEKEVLGFYLSDHPLIGMDQLTRPWTTCSIKETLTMEPKQKVAVMGIIATQREIITKKGTRMAFAQLEDLTGSLELVVFPDAYAASETILKSEGALIITGKLEREGEQAKILVEKVERVSDVLKRAKRLVIQANEKMQDQFDSLKTLMGQHPGETAMTMEMKLPDTGKSISMELKEPKGITASYEFFEGVHKIFGSTDGFHLRT